MEAVRVRLGSLVEWAVAALFLVASVGVASLAMRERAQPPRSTHLCRRSRPPHRPAWRNAPSRSSICCSRRGRKSASAAPWPSGRHPRPVRGDGRGARRRRAAGRARDPVLRLRRHPLRARLRAGPGPRSRHGHLHPVIVCRRRVNRAVDLARRLLRPIGLGVRGSTARPSGGGGCGGGPSVRGLGLLEGLAAAHRVAGAASARRRRVRRRSAPARRGSTRCCGPVPRRAAARTSNPWDSLTRWSSVAPDA